MDVGKRLDVADEMREEPSCVLSIPSSWPLLWFRLPLKLYNGEL
jgi:hypothetical protein